MREIGKLGVVLLLISAIAALLLSVTNELTYGQIITQRENANKQFRKEVLSDAEKFEPIAADTLNGILKTNEKVMEIYAGYNGGKLVGYAIKTGPQGYGGTVEVLTGIDVNGVIKGVRVGTHQETPGLGANATLPNFYDLYEDKNVEMSIKVAKANPKEDEIQAMSGATITSKAVTTGVNYAIDAYKQVIGE